MSGVETAPDPGDSAPRLHRRQFVLGPEPRPVAEDWICRPVGSATWLSHCPELRVEECADADGQARLLLGIAVATEPGAPPPRAAIEASRGESLAALAGGWSGRWLLVGADEVQPDASAQLACCHGRDAQGRIWASSSPALLARELPDVHAGRPRALIHATGLSWVPAPAMHHPAMRRLLPSQALSLAEGVPRARHWMPPIAPAHDDDACLEELVHGLAEALRRLAGAGDPLWLGLSAGGDSRMVLVAARVAGIELRTFTRRSPRSSLADQALPPRLARSVGFEHVFLPSRRMERSRWPLVQEHAGHHVSRGDAEPLLRGERDALRGVCVGGQGFGIGKLKLRGLPAEVDEPAHVAAALARAHGEPADSEAVPVLAEWLAWVDATPVTGLDWRDRFQIEQQMAGWQAAKEQVYDMSAVARLSPLNSVRLFALLLSMSETARRDRRYVRTAQERWAPELAGFPINPPDADFGRVQAFVRRTRHSFEQLRKRLQARAERLRAGR